MLQRNQKNLLENILKIFGNIKKIFPSLPPQMIYKTKKVLRNLIHIEIVKWFSPLVDSTFRGAYKTVV